MRTRRQWGERERERERTTHDVQMTDTDTGTMNKDDVLTHPVSAQVVESRSTLLVKRLDALDRRRFVVVGPSRRLPPRHHSCQHDVIGDVDCHRAFRSA